MRRIILLILIILVSFSDCANKKKKALLFPFLALLNSEEPGAGKSASTQGTAVPGSQVNVPPAPSNLVNSESDAFLVNSGTSSSQVIPVNAAGTQSLNTSLPEAGVVLSGQDETFVFKTTTSVPVSMTIYDSNQTPVPGAVVSIYEIDSTNGETNVVFQQISDASGYVEGSLVVNQSSSQIEATVSVGSETTKPVPIPLEVAVKSENGESRNVAVAAITSLNLPIQITPASTVADRDGDGVPDHLDFYPDDATKASKIRIPSSGVNTASFEDLFPSAGDADLNDYVIQFYNEEDLNAKGEVVEVRGEYQHVSKGAGYKHTLNLKLPAQFTVCRDDKDKGHGNNQDGVDADNPGASTGINQNALDNRKATFNTKCTREETVGLDVSFESTIYDGLDIDTKTGRVRYTPSLEEIRDGFEILGDSSKTIASSNVDPTKPYKPGHRASVKIKFNKPVPKTKLGNAPYDLFIRVLSKKIDNKYPQGAPQAENAGKQFYEVHFPGFYFQSGKDVYLDNKGFPWAVLVPSVWAWPLEGKTYDIRGSKSAYPRFKTWMESNGKLDKDWYMHPDKTYAYPLPEVSSSLAAYLKDIDSISFGLALGIILTGLGILFLRKKFMIA